MAELLARVTALKDYDTIILAAGTYNNGSDFRIKYARPHVLLHSAGVLYSAAGAGRITSR
jgi:hypothetical protein